MLLLRIIIDWLNPPLAIDVPTMNSILELNNGNALRKPSKKAPCFERGDELHDP
jgi:hypothetical protein